jgi:hypothetical protein
MRRLARRVAAATPHDRYLRWQYIATLPHSFTTTALCKAVQFAMADAGPPRGARALVRTTKRALLAGRCRMGCAVRTPLPFSRCNCHTHLPPLRRLQYDARDFANVAFIGQQLHQDILPDAVRRVDLSPQHWRALQALRQQAVAAAAAFRELRTIPQAEVDAQLAALWLVDEGAGGVPGGDEPSHWHTPRPAPLPIATRGRSAASRSGGDRCSAPFLARCQLVTQAMPGELVCSVSSQTRPSTAAGDARPTDVLLWEPGLATARTA